MQDAIPGDATPPPLCIDAPDAFHWDEAADLVIAGLGGLAWPPHWKPSKAAPA